MGRKIRIFFKEIHLALLYLSRIKTLHKADIPFGINKGKKAVVLGNAPSLKYLIQKFHDKGIDIPNDAFFVNYSPLDKFFYEVKPNHLFISDECFYLDNDRNKQMYSNLQNRVDWDLTIYITRHFKKDCQRLVNIMGIDNPKIRYRFLYKRSCDDFEPSLRNKLFKTGFFMPTESTVVNTALWVAILEGYSEVELYGIDTDQFRSLEVGDDNKLYIVEHHFNEPDVRHPIVSDTIFRPLKMHEMLNVYAGMLKSYCILADFAEYMGTKVYNCSPGSAVDAFDRKNTLGV